MKRALLFICLGVAWLKLSAINLSETEKDLKILFNELHNSTTDSLRIQINDSICKRLTIVANNDSSFRYAFDSLPYLGKIYSTDKRIRIYSWNYINNDGNFQFSTCIQIPKNKSFVISQHNSYSLPSETQNISDKDWYGALYYEAIPFPVNNKTGYILLGWSQLASQIQFKVIDVLTVSDNQVSFGAPIFKQNDKTLNRIVLSYSSHHSLSLLYNPKKEAFVFNHLTENADNNAQIPDESFAGYFIHQKNLFYKEDVTINAAKE